jgi:hypothetical protein
VDSGWRVYLKKSQVKKAWYWLLHSWWDTILLCKLWLTT